jgi:cytochrome c peroxidase
MRPIRLVAAGLLLVAGAALPGCSRAVKVLPDQVVAGAASTDFEQPRPPGFPEPLVPEDNPLTAEKIELGRYLFYDRRLSGTGTQACADCHRQELAFTDGLARAVGSTGEIHPRSSMSLGNAAYGATLTWSDVNVRELEQQALVPMFNEHPVELGVTGNEEKILRRLEDDGRYGEMFAGAFPDDGDPVTIDNIARALASFERTLISGESAYHRLLYRGEMDALSSSARRGMDLFFSERLGCSECHAGMTLSGPVVFEGGREIEPTFHNTGLYNVDGRGGYPPDDQGLLEVTGKPEDMGRFRAPTLVNVALTAPYMHDGSLATLDEVVDFYSAAGMNRESGDHAGDGRANPLKSELIRGFEIDAAGKRDLIAFLESLTDHAFVSDPRFSDPFRAARPAASDDTKAGTGGP